MNNYIYIDDEPFFIDYEDYIEIIDEREKNTETINEQKEN